MIAVRQAFLLALFLPPWLASARAAEIAERVLKVPVKFEDMYRKTIAREITVTVFEQPGGAPYPLMVLSHGRPPNNSGRHNFGRARFPDASKYFASLGYSVWVPTRIGYGVGGNSQKPGKSGPVGTKTFSAPVARPAPRGCLRFATTQRG